MTIKHNDNSLNFTLIVIAVLLTFIVFTIDKHTELGVAIGVAYVTVILLGLRISQKWFIPVFVFVCSILVLLGFYKPHLPTIELWKAIANRGLSIFAIWITGVLCFQQNKKIASLINNAEYIRSIDLLYVVTSTAHASNSIEEAIKISLEHICHVLGWPIGHVYFVESHKNFEQELIPGKLWYLDDATKYKAFKELTEATPFNKGVGLPGRVWVSGKPAWVADVTKDKNFPRAFDNPEIGIRSAVAFPIIFKESTVAVFEFFSPKIIKPGEEILRIMSEIGFQLGRLFDRKQNEEILRFHSNILSNLAEGVFLSSSREGVIVFTNQQFDRMFGYEQGELIGKRVSILNAPTNLNPELIANKIMDQLKQTGVWHGEILNVKKDGTTFWSNANVSSYCHPQFGNVWIASHTDISERKLMEETLEQYRNQLEQRVEELTPELIDARKRLEYSMSMAHIMTTHVGLDGRWLKVPKNLCDLVGYSEEELLTQTFKQITHPDDFMSDWSQRQRLIAGAMKSFEIEKRYIHKNGQVIWIYLNCSIVHDKEEKPDYFLSYIIDITQKKEIELQLKQSEQRLKVVLHSLVGGDWEWNLLTGKVVFTLQWLESLGYSSGELVSTIDTWKHLVHPDDLLRINKFFQEYFNGKNLSYKFEYRIRSKSGEWRWRISQGIPTAWDNNGKPTYMIGSELDVTERKKSEETQSRLIEILEGASDFVGFADAKDTHMLYVNKAGRHMTGLGAEEDVTKLKIADVHPENTNRMFRNEILNTATRDGIWQGECEFLHRDGHTIPALMILIAHKSKSGEVEVFSTISRDITKLKQNEINLRNSIIEKETLLKEISRAEKRFRRYFESPMIGIAITSPSKGWIEVNEKLCQIFGYDREALLKMTWTEITHPDDLEQDVAMFNRVIAGEIDSYSLDKRFIRHDGEVIHASISACCIRLANGDVDYFIALVQDITKSKRIEREKLFIEERLQRVIDGSHDIFWEWDAKADKLWWSPNFYETLGYVEGETPDTYLTFASLVHPDDIESHYRAIDQHLNDNSPFRSECRLKTASGDYKWFYGSGKCVRDESGVPVIFSGSTQDITERKNITMKLEKSESNLRAIIEISPIPLALHDEQQNIIFLNASFIKLFGYTLKDIPTVNDWWPKAYPDPQYRQSAMDSWVAAVEKAKREGESPIPVEYNVRCADGAVKTVTITARPLDESIGINLVIFYDITELKQNEERLKNSLVEKEILLKEISHRTKNNMQIISSLINIQLSATKDHKFKTLAMDLGNRIFAMSLAYNMIFQSKNLYQEVEMQGYIHDLTQNIMSSYGKNNHNIKLTIDAKNIYIDVGTSIYCGLIINELVSNCFKHAFAPNQSGIVNILFQRKNGKLELTVQDNGVGIPDGIDIYKVESMGMALTINLVENQLHGKIELNRNSGTKIKAVFLPKESS